MFKKLAIILCALFLFPAAAVEAATVIREKGRIYIKDRHGEKWDVTQAKSLGFKPGAFQYGIGRHAIPPLDEKSFTSQTTWVSGSMRVIGFSETDAAKAVSVNKLRRHEILNTEIDNKPVAAAYWPLVDLSAVYSRHIDGRKLTIAPSGWTYNDTFVLYDKETGSLWYPYEKGLMGIQGHFFKKWLPILPHTDTSWATWRRKHPDSLIAK